MSFRWQNVVLVINFSSCLSSLPQPQPLADWCCSFVAVFGVVVVVAVAFVALLAKAKHSPTFAHNSNLSDKSTADDPFFGGGGRKMRGRKGKNGKGPECSRAAHQFRQMNYPK